jgi:hypothetical protein
MVHLPYNPDLAPNVFWQVPECESELKGNNFMHVGIKLSMKKIVDRFSYSGL